ncbi:S8 family serine peptidase [Pedobacter punctiformis]|uniref:S8 family serine peptidase n=1 Tax=Pedobacter punctiformis TaxID=3004097 RepID=A0ABT4LAT9_9SPHI|nr:S8 family serine peptidase [Pedobacter sp. HCMS5-2]MCZ4245047.1 S8 family serine peptidase [Pedobacter sp. HCMS5-2]
MKKQTLLLVLLSQFIVITGQAQLVQKKSKEKIADWYNLSQDKDGVYGAEVNKAYEFLKGKPVKKKPVVAIIGFGMDAEHEDLKNVQWTNLNEKADDGIDNDKDGWIDDIHGWNFLGNAKGEMIEKTNKEGDREYFRLRGLYEGIFFNGTDYMKFDDVQQKPVKVPAPVNLAEYKYFRYALQKESQIAAAAISYQASKFNRYYLTNDLDAAVKKMYPDLSKVGQKEFIKATNYLDRQGAKVDSLQLMARYFFLIGMGVNNGYANRSKGDSVKYESYRDLVLKTNKSKNDYDQALAKTVDARKITGDDFSNINQKNYGNNNLYSNGSFYGTMFSGVIAADRDNNIGIKGIMPQAQLMSLRAYPKEGEPYYKDIALAIRYAVDHKADVILLGSSNSIYPAYEAKWVNDALLYAEQKGVLIVSSVWDLSRDLSKQSFYPNQFINGKELNNFIQVAASDSLGVPLKTTNFGAKELNLYAPGVGISTTYMGTTYRQAGGSGLSAACVAGTAALIKAYYPQLTGAQIRKLILGNVTDRKDVEVEKQVGTKTDMYLFSQLCSSGGILNAYKAVVAADKQSKTK